MKELVPNLLWTDYDAIRMAGLPVGRRATVARGADEQLVVFSPLKATHKSVSSLKQLDGKIAAFIVPSRFHDSFFDGYFSHFPSTPFLAGKRAIEDHPKWPLTEFSPDRSELNGFEYHQVEGVPRSEEHVFFHQPTRTLIVADLLFNIPQAAGLLTRLLMRVADMGGKPRPSRLWRSLIRSDEQFARSVKTISQWDFDRIIPGHGDVIETDGKRVFVQAFERWLSGGLTPR